MKCLYRITLEPSDVWSKFYGQKIKPLYVIADNKGDALSSIEIVITIGLKCKRIVKLGEQRSGVIFSGNFNENK